MAERFSEGEGFVREDRSLQARLKEYSELKAKIEAMLAIIATAGGHVEKAAEAEQRIIDGLRQRGEMPWRLARLATGEDGFRSG